MPIGSALTEGACSTDVVAATLQKLAQAEAEHRSAKDKHAACATFENEKVVLRAEMAVEEIKCEIKTAELEMLLAQGKREDEVLVVLAKQALDDARELRNKSEARLDGFSMSAAAPQGRKRLMLGGEPGVGRFMTKIVGADPAGSGVWQLEEPLWGSRARRDNVVIRQCYETLAHQIIEHLDSGYVLVGGSGGVGKSVFGLFLVARLLRRGEVIVYQHEDERMLLFGKEAVPSTLSAISSYLQWHGYERLQGPGVYSFPSALTGLAHSEGIVLVLDAGRSNVQVLTTGPSRKVVISSPNADILCTFVAKTPNTKVLCMPLWTLAELKSAAGPLAQKELDALCRRFQKFGGVPRFVVEMSESNADHMMLLAIQDATPEDIAHSLIVSYELMRRNDLRSYLVHTVLLPENTASPSNVLASSWVARELMCKFRLKSAFSQTQDFCLQTFFNRCSGIKSLQAYRGQAYRGVFLEALVHEALINGTGNFTLAPLKPEGMKRFATCDAFPAMREVHFNGDTLDSLPGAIFEKEYLRPTSLNFDALDSFAVLPRSLFVAKAKGVCLVGFQITVSRSHDVTAKGLRAVYDGVLSRLSSAHKKECESGPMILVFVTDKDGICQPQEQSVEPETGPNSKALNEFPVSQFVLRVGSALDGFKEMYG